ncbi:hypothetical protein EIP91_010351 [Steccherinum ochraceum]|uniref:F-box domain-containing protein n=1 Tax=Steccherinum ochraceum TaxID=92696 RepID=A0A4V2MUY3_9APHY|nr:hypothetical protein EIP91_010351 [Steccherinum ochraceum]
MSSLFLPAELKWIVARHLSGDAATLSALSLVSKPWLDASQAVLFSQLDYTLDSPGALGNLICFFAEHPRLAACTKWLVLQGGTESLVEFELQEIFSLLDLMRGVRAFTLHHCDLNGPSEPLVFRHPCNLFVSAVHADIRTLASLCSCLEGHTLAIDDLYPYDPVYASPALFGTMRALDFSNVREMAGTASHLPPLWREVLLRSCSDNLVSVGLSMDLSEPLQSATCWNFLQRKGRCVEHLRLNISETYFPLFDDAAERIIDDEVGSDGFGGIPQDWEHHMLSEGCPLLKSVTLVILADMEDASFNTEDTILQWRYALRLLSSCPSTITHIFIELYAAGERTGTGSLNTAEEVDWAKWGEVLQRFQNLESFRFVASGRHWVPGLGDICEIEPITTTFISSWETYVCEELPSCRLQDVLESTRSSSHPLAMTAV